MRKSAPRARLCTSGTDEIYLYSRPAASGGVRSLWRSRTHSHSLGRGAKLLHPTPHGPRDTGRARCHSPLKGQYPPYPLRPPPRALLHPYRRLPQVRTPRPPPRHRPRRVLPVLCYPSRPLSRRPLRPTPRRTPTTVTGPIHHNHRHRYARSDPNGGGACVSTAHSDRCSHSPSLPTEVATPTLAVTPTLGPTETLPESPTRPLPRERPGPPPATPTPLPPVRLSWEVDLKIDWPANLGVIGVENLLVGVTGDCPGSIGCRASVFDPSAFIPGGADSFKVYVCHPPMNKFDCEGEELLS